MLKLSTTADCSLYSPSLYFHHIHIPDSNLLTPRTITIYSIVSLLLMAVALALVWFKAVPQKFFVPLFAFSLTLFVIRIVLRIVLARQERRRNNDDGSST